MKINKTRLTISPPAPFDFQKNALSHGWINLAPNHWDAKRRVLRRAEHLKTGKVVLLEIGAGHTAKQPEIIIKVSHTGRLAKTEQREIIASVGRMFRVDEDLSPFFDMCKKRGGSWLKASQSMGRLLRSPTVFEDAVKVICTTNIQWNGTRRMIEGLVRALGEPYAGDSRWRAFPGPKRMAAAAPETFTEAVRLGYRGDYIHTLARRIASGDLDLENFRSSNMPTPGLKKELKAIKGVGDYAAASLLMLLGRYDELAIDTVFREFVAKKYFKGRRPSNQEARAVYRDWGEWKYLAFWFDIRGGLD